MKARYSLTEQKSTCARYAITELHIVDDFRRFLYVIAVH